MMLTTILLQAPVTTPRPEIDVFAHIVTHDYSQLIISIVSILIATLSIVYTALSYQAQRKYNKTVLRSFITIIVNDYSNKFELCLRNSGLGPAILKSFTIEKGDHRYSSIEAFYASFEKELEATGKSVTLSEKRTFQENEVLYLGTSITLFGIDERNYENRKPIFQEHLGIIKNNFNNSKVTVVFESLGEENAQTKTEKNIYTNQ